MASLTPAFGISEEVDAMKTWKELLRQKNFMFKLGLFICAAWIIIAVFAPLIAPHSPTLVVMEDRFQPPGRSTGLAPTTWAGTCLAGCCTAAGCPSPAA